MSAERRAELEVAARERWHSKYTAERTAAALAKVRASMAVRVGRLLGADQQRLLGGHPAVSDRSFDPRKDW